MLAYGCIGESVCLGPNFDGINLRRYQDILTSKISTLPYDDDKMQKMINFVQNAKGTLLCNKGDQAH